MADDALRTYLQRIGYSGPVEPTLDVLFGIHRAHIDSVPYENLEIQLGRENTLIEDDFIHKIVHRRRGGWCYEMNGILTWALRRIGFRVTRISASVAREILGDFATDNHLIGLVDLGGRWVVDVGLGDGPRDPFPLSIGEWDEGPLHFRLERLDDGWWRFHNHALGMAPSFDFLETPRALESMQKTCTMLQTDEGSPFVGNAIIMRRTPAGFDALRDTTFVRAADGKKTETGIESVDRFDEIVTRLLGVELGEDLEVLWKKVSARATERRDEG